MSICVGSDDCLRQVSRERQGERERVREGARVYLVVIVRAPLVGYALHAPVEGDGQLEEIFAPQLIHGTGLGEGGKRRWMRRKRRRRKRERKEERGERVHRQVSIWIFGGHIPLSFPSSPFFFPPFPPTVMVSMQWAGSFW